MGPRRDFIPLKPLEEWYESFWLRPRPAKQSKWPRRPRGAIAIFRRVTGHIFRWPASVQRREEAAPNPEAFQP